MFTVALCDCPASRKIVEEKITAFLAGFGAECEITEFETLEGLKAQGNRFDMYFVNRSFSGAMETLLADFAQKLEKSEREPREKFKFVFFLEDPVSADILDTIIEHMRRHLEYESMQFAVEFLTDKGLRSIAISKILYFEFCDRKIKIRTQGGEFFCRDTLRNVMSLVGNHGFRQPHKAFIVNLQHITDIRDYAIAMSGGDVVPLSQKKSCAFRKAYKAYLEKRHARIAKKAR